MTYKSLLMAIVATTVLVACSSDDEIPEKVNPTGAGTFTDQRDGQTYRYVRYGALDWMAENYRYDTGSSTSSIYVENYEHESNPTSTANLDRYGRLYTLEGAREAQPEGWRLPTDADWQALEHALGMSNADTQNREWRGNIARSMLTTKGDSCALSLLLGGYETTHTIMATTGWRHKGVFGYYWTNTPDTDKDGNYYFFRKLVYNSTAVYRESMETEANKLSVRYVRDAQ